MAWHGVAEDFVVDACATNPVFNSQFSTMFRTPLRSPRLCTSVTSFSSPDILDSVCACSPSLSTSYSRTPRGLR